ncbi:hypothetical protein [Azospirillum sp. sgz301742]
MKELRCLVFTDQEVVKAILDRRRKMREPLPAGTVRGVTYSSDHEAIHTTIRVLDDYGVDQSMTIGTAEAAAALVGYCMGRKVPLPVDSDKCLHLINGGLTLMITMNFNKPPRLVTESHDDAADAGNSARLAG